MGEKPKLWFERVLTETVDGFERQVVLHACTMECARKHMETSGHKTWIIPNSLLGIR